MDQDKNVRMGETELMSKQTIFWRKKGREIEHDEDLMMYDAKTF